MSQLQQSLPDRKVDAIASRFPQPLRGFRLLDSRDAIRVTHFSADVEATLADAVQRNYRQYKASRACPTCNVLNDWFSRDSFAGKQVLELGPGHYTFAMLARHFGASVTCIEKDPVLARLGRILGFQVEEANFLIQDSGAELMRDASFDGVWLRGVMNACSFPDVDALGRYVNQLSRLLRPGGWGWSANCNTAGASDGEDRSFTESRIEAQRAAFEAAGWDVTPVYEQIKSRYRLNFVGCRYIFTKNLPSLTTANALGIEL